MNLKLLKDKRKLLGLTQEEFAERIGIARTNYLKKEKGRENFKREQIDKIIKELNLTPKEVVEIFFNK